MWASVTCSEISPFYPSHGLPLPAIFLASPWSPPLCSCASFASWCVDQRGQLYENVDRRRCSQVPGVVLRWRNAVPLVTLLLACR